MRKQSSALNVRDTEAGYRVDLPLPGGPVTTIFRGSLAAEVAILIFLHVGRKIRPNPVTLAVNDALRPKLAYSRLAARNSRSMMRVTYTFLTRGFWKRNRLHIYSLAPWSISRPDRMNQTHVQAFEQLYGSKAAFLFGKANRAQRNCRLPG
jgi:hypothetical protein